MSYLKGLGERISYKEEPFSQLIDIEMLAPSKDNFYGIRDIEELAESIKETTLLHNLVVRKIEDNKYEILSGERRYQALKLLEVKKVPCKVVELDDLDSQILLIQANSRQRELTPIEKMQGISKLKALYEYKREKGIPLPKGKKTRDLIGELLGMSGSQVAKLQSIGNNVIEEFINLYDKGDISQEESMTLGSLSAVEQASIYERIKDLDSKEFKNEIAILVNGIKQPVESKEDKKLLEEMFPSREAETLTETMDNINILQGQIEQQITELPEEYSVVSEDKESAAEIVLEGQSFALGEEEIKVEPIDNVNSIGSSPELKHIPMYLNLEKLLEYDPCPKLILDIMGVESILFTSKITIQAMDNLNCRHKLSIELIGLEKKMNRISIPLSSLEKVDRIPNGMQPKMGYKIHQGVYLMFKRKVGEK